MQEKFKGRCALVTGASAGIGAAFARAYAQMGADVVLTARRSEPLAALAQELKDTYQVNALALPFDLSVPETPEQLIDAAVSELGAVDILVNNAGYGVAKRFHEVDWETHNAFLRVLLHAPCELAHRALPHMQKQNWGRIINIASIVALVPPASGHTLYACSKAGLLRFSQSLNAEQDGTNVKVTAVCPGLTWSEFHDVNGQREKVSKMPGYMWQTAEAVAKEGIRANEANKSRYITGRVNRMIFSMAQHLPEDIATGIMKRRSASLGKDGR